MFSCSPPQSSRLSETKFDGFVSGSNLSMLCHARMNLIDFASIALSNAISGLFAQRQAYTGV